MTKQPKNLVEGTDIELYDQAIWSRATVADGKWLQNETLEPISANDRILASAIKYVSGGVDYVSARVTLLEDASDVINVYGDWNDFINNSADLFDTSVITDNDIIKVLNDKNSYPNELFPDAEVLTSGHQTYFRWTVTAEDPHKPIIPSEGKWNYIGYLDPYYNTSEIDDIIDDLSATVKDEYVPWSATDCPIGDKNIANNYSLAQGIANSATNYSFAQGSNNNADNQSLAQGSNVSAKNYSIGIGTNVKVIDNSLAVGYDYKTTSNTLEASDCSVNIGKNYSAGDRTCLIGEGNKCANRLSFAQGSSNYVKEESFAQGVSNSAEYRSLAQGYTAYAYTDSLAQGNSVTAKNNSMAQGTDGIAEDESFAQGSHVSACDYSLAQGQNNSAINVAQALGEGLIIDGGMAIGKYNKTTDARFVIGNGTDNDHRSDLFLINKNGNTTSIGAAYFTGFSGTNISGLTQTASIDGLINSAANGGSMTGLKNASGLEFQYQDGSTPTAITAALQTSADKLIFVPSSGCADWLKFATDGYDSIDNSQIIKILTPNFQSQIEALDTKKLDVSSLNLRITGTAPTLTSAYVGINSIPFQAKYDDMGNVINETYLMEHKFTAWSGSTASVFSGTSRSAQNAYSAQSAYSAQKAGSAGSAEYFGGKLPSAYMQVANIGRDANGNISSYGGSAIAGLGDYVPKSATNCPIGSNNTAVSYAFAQGTTNSADTTAFAQGDSNKTNTVSFAQGNENTAANYSLAQGWQSSAERHSMVQGVNNTAYNLSFAQGDLNFADGLSLAQGEETLARWGSIAQGSGTSATNRSQAFGEGTVANASGMAIGTYNKTYDAAFIIGNGTKTNQSTNRSDLLVIDHSGNMVITAIYPSKQCSATYSPSGIHLNDSVRYGYDVYLTNEGVFTTGYDGSTTIPMSARWLDIIDPRKNYVSAMGELPIVISAVTNLPTSLEEGIYYLV